VERDKVTEYNYRETSREYLIQGNCRETFDFLWLDLQDLQLFGVSLERLIAAEDQRIANRSTEPPEEYEGWWLEDIVAFRLRHAYLCAVLDTVAFNLKRICKDAALIGITNPPTLNREVVLEARRFLVGIGFAQPTEADWQDLADLYAIRNTVVHNCAAIPEGEDGQRFHRVARRLVGVSVAEGLVELDDRFCTALHDRIVCIFKMIRDEQNALCERSRRVDSNLRPGQNSRASGTQEQRKKNDSGDNQDNGSKKRD
jgi:hypothetical protein